MMQFVPDASFCGAWILPDEASAEADRLLQRVEARTAALVVPPLWHYEMGNLIRSAVRRKRLDTPLAFEAIRLIAAVPVITPRPPEPETMSEILRESLHTGLSFYDATYLELALRLRLPLLTTDQQLHQAATARGLITTLSP